MEYDKNQLVEEVDKLEKLIGYIEKEYGESFSSQDLLKSVEEHFLWTMREALGKELKTRYRQPKKFRVLIQELLRRRADGGEE